MIRRFKAFCKRFFIFCAVFFFILSHVLIFAFTLLNTSEIQGMSKCVKRIEIMEQYRLYQELGEPDTQMEKFDVGDRKYMF